MEEMGGGDDFGWVSCAAVAQTDLEVTTQNTPNRLNYLDDGGQYGRSDRRRRR
jgi:hypothetical protein